MYLLTEAQFAQLEAIFDSGSPTRFVEIYTQIHTWLQAPDSLGNAADENVQAWFGAAEQANSGQGGASDFIRTYTAEQLAIRQGESPEDIDAILQFASNAIGQAVYNDILRETTVVDGITYHVVPSAYQIGQNDAQSTVEALVSQIPSYDGGVVTWSGNPLFIGLGISDFWLENILGDASNTYDLAVAVRAMYAGLGASANPSSMGDLLSLFAGQGFGGGGRGRRFRVGSQGCDIAIS